MKDIDLHRVLGSMQDSYIIVTDMEGVVLFLNKQPDAYTYLEPYTYVGASIYDSIPEKLKPSFIESMQNLINTGSVFRTNIQKKEHGIKAYYDIRYSLVLGEFDQANFILIEGKDVTEEKIVSNKITRVSNDFENLVENANAVIIGTDTQGNITYWNENCEKATGYSKSEAFTHQVSELLLGKEKQSDFLTLWDSLLKGVQLSNYELTIISKDGAEQTLLLNGTPRKNMAGFVDGILFVGQNISELAEYRKSIEKKISSRTFMLQESMKETQFQRETLQKEMKRSDELLRNILPERVALEIKQKGHAAPRHYSEVSILFADLVGFTKLCKGLSPEDIVYELNYIFVGFDMILERNGVEKIKSIGDGYMAVGGLETSNNEHALGTVKAGLEMVEYLNRLSIENQKSSRPAWQVRIGIHTGELIAGVIGRNKLAYDVWGAAVNTASRMESSGEAGKVNISQATYELVKHKFNCAHRGTIDVKNMGTMSMFFVD